MGAFLYPTDSRKTNKDVGQDWTQGGPHGHTINLPIHLTITAECDFSHSFEQELPQQFLRNHQR